MLRSLFISYAPTDKALFEKLETHLLPLQRDGKLTYWHGGMTPGGGNKRQLRTERLESAQVLICLISPDYLANMDEELQQLLERHARGAVLVPVLARPVLITKPAFKQLQSLPRNGRPITQWASPEDGWLDVVQGLWELIESSQDPAAGADPHRPQGVQTPAALPPPSPRKLRILLEEILRTDSDLEAFCLDFFPDVKRLFGNAMDRKQKVSLLFEKEQAADILKALQDGEPKAFARCKHLLS